MNLLYALDYYKGFAMLMILYNNLTIIIISQAELLDESCGAKLDFQDCFSCQKGVKTAAFFERNIFAFILSFAIGGFIITSI